MRDLGDSPRAGVAGTAATTTQRASRLALQWGSALLLLTAASLHLYLWFDYFRTVHVVGMLFLLNFVAGTAIGLSLLIRAAPLLIVAGLAFSLATLGAFLASVTVGLFGYSERLRGPWQESAGAVEVASLVVLAPLLLVVLRSRQVTGARLRLWPPRPMLHR